MARPVAKELTVLLATIRDRNGEPERVGMRTLLYCTGYSAMLAEWEHRYRPWLDAVKRLGIADQILIIDDASTTLPGWSDLRISSGDSVNDALAPIDPDTAILHRFSRRLGRISSVDCRGWYRSYGFGVAYAVEHGFDRVIHLESDAYILSDRLTTYLSTFNEGWGTLWSEKYQFPEMAIQFAAGNGLQAFHEYTQRPYDSGLAGTHHEHVVPFTHIERGFIGDRYGETNDPIPRGIDFVSQIPPQREATYYWWSLESAPFTADAVLEDQALRYDFNDGGNSDDIVGEGWSHQEPEFRWMIGYSSTLRLPRFQNNGGVVLRINIYPLLHDNGVRLQNLRLVLNGHPVGKFDLQRDLIIGAILPRHMLRRDGTDIVTLIHPDAIAPSTFVENFGDDRALSMAVRYMCLVPMQE